MLTPAPMLRAVEEHSWSGQVTPTAGDRTATIVHPTWAHYWALHPMFNWNAGGWWVISQTANQMVIGFAVPAPAVAVDGGPPLINWTIVS